jgi:hypothetical protein
MRWRGLELGLITSALVVVPFVVFVFAGAGHTLTLVDQARATLVSLGVKPNRCVERGTVAVTCTLKIPTCAKASDCSIVYSFPVDAVGGRAHCFEPSPNLGYGSVPPPSCTVSFAAGVLHKSP